MKRTINTLTIVGYLYKDNKVKPLNIMLSKTSAYLIDYDGQTELIYFVILYGIKSALI